MKQNLKKWLILAFFHVCARLPRFLLNPLSAIFAFFLWHSKGASRRVTLVNLELCYPHLSAHERERMAKASIREMALTALEFPGICLQSEEKLLKRITQVSGDEKIQQAQESGKGVLVIFPHLGNWEYMGLFLGKCFQSTTLYKPSEEDFMEKLIKTGRSKTGATLVPTDKSGVKSLVKALKEQKLVSILPDQVPDANAGGIVAPFFGQETMTMSLVPNLMKRGNIVAVGGVALRQADGTFKVVFVDADEDIYGSTPEQVAKGMNKTIENLVALAPEQYQWEYKRFKRGPDGKTRFYKKP